MKAQFDVIILGGGAAGLMCAIEAGKRARRVAVLERAERIGKKILISGGGRCNFTNVNTRPDRFTILEHLDLDEEAILDHVHSYADAVAS